MAKSCCIPLMGWTFSSRITTVYSSANVFMYSYANTGWIFEELYIVFIRQWPKHTTHCNKQYITIKCYLSGSDEFQDLTSNKNTVAFLSKLQFWCMHYIYIYILLYPILTKIVLLYNMIKSGLNEFQDLT